MKKELKIHQKTIYTILYLLISFTLTNVIAGGLGVSFIGFNLMLITSFIGLMVQLLFLFPFGFYLLLLLSFILYIILNQFFQNIIFNIADKLYAFITNTWNYIKGYENLHPENIVSLWLLVTILVTTVTFLIIFKLKLKWSLLFLYGGLLTYFWYNYVDKAYPMLILFLCLFIVFIGLENYRTILENNKNEKNRGANELFKPWLRISVTYGLIIVLSATLLPKGGNLVEWSWLQGQMAARFPSLFDLRTDLSHSRTFGAGELFDFTRTGFQSDETRLGGPVELNDRLVMTVRASFPMYLRGNIKTIYEDSTWKFGRRYQVEFETGDPLPREVFFGWEEMIEIQNENFASFTLFSPFQPIEVTTDIPNRMWVDVNNQITLQGGRYRNESYKIRAFIPSGGGEYNYGGLSSHMLEEYLQLPDEISRRIEKLTLSIVPLDGTPYEQARKIEKFLRENYKYNHQVPHTPEGRDFVEYFLFDLKEGYCTYFATAMAIMLRSINIPSRYVEGFRMPDEAVDRGYEIRLKNAHAWVEAYFESMGWITFEPTPAYSPPHTPDYGVFIPISTINNEGDFDDMAALIARGFGEEDLIDDSNSSSNNATTDETGVPQDGIILGSRVRESLQYFILFILFAILPARGLYMYWKIKKYKSPQFKKDYTVLHGYKNIMELLEKLNYPIVPGETPNEYAERMSNKLNEGDYSIREITSIYISTKYGMEEAKEMQLQKIEKYFIFIENKVRYQLGLWKYLYVKYIKGNLYTIFPRD